jgi:hypothetical protein
MNTSCCHSLLREGVPEYVLKSGYVTNCALTRLKGVGWVCMQVYKSRARLIWPGLDRLQQRRNQGGSPGQFFDDHVLMRGMRAFADCAQAVERGNP